MTAFVLFFRVARSRSILLTAVKVAIIVGVILNLINQGDLILGGNFAGVHWTKFCLTFCVPFCVSVYSATQAKMLFDPGTRALVDAQLRCKTCNETVRIVHRDEIIPECPTCMNHTLWLLDKQRSD